jgi:hypothetical protein
VADRRTSTRLLLTWAWGWYALKLGALTWVLFRYTVQAGQP